MQKSCFRRELGVSDSNDQDYVMLLRCCGLGGSAETKDWQSPVCKMRGCDNDMLAPDTQCQPMPSIQKPILWPVRRLGNIIYANLEMLPESRPESSWQVWGSQSFSPFFLLLVFNSFDVIPVVNSEGISTPVWHEDISVPTENQTLLVSLFTSDHL